MFSFYFRKKIDQTHLLVKLSSICLCFMMSFVGFSCEEDEDYPMQMTFEKYLPNDNKCGVIDIVQNEVVIVNGEEKLKKHIVCENVELPKINFVKHSLLLVKGQSVSGVGDINISLNKVDVDKYVMDVVVHEDMTTAAPSWLISIVTPKIKDTDVITLNVSYKNI